MHGKSTDADGRFCGHTKCLRKIPQGARKVDGSWWKVLRMQGMLTVGPENVKKFDGSLRKGPRPHVKFMKVHGKSRGRTKTWWKVPHTHGNLIEVHWRSRRCKKSWHKSLGHMESWWKFTDNPTDACKINIKSRGRTECSRKYIESPADAKKIDGWSSGHRECWQKVPWTHIKLT